MKNQYRIVGNKVFINAKGCGRETECVIDLEDLELVSEYPNAWYLNKDGYVRGLYLNANGKRIETRLHRWIMNPEKSSVYVDHIDGDVLNNSRSNLRICTSRQNQYNSKKPNRKTTSKYKGVCICTMTGKWNVRIKTDGKYKHCGSFISEVEAAAYYNEMAKKYYGEFARLNEVGA